MLNRLYKPLQISIPIIKAFFFGFMGLVYFGGFWGMIFAKEGFHQMFLALTPLNLLLTSVFLVYTEKRNAFLWFILVFVFGYLLEVLGVQTGFPFGPYYYGETLGPKLYQTPIIIGVNWFIVSYATFQVAAQIFNATPLRIALATLLMVFLDYFIEGVAPRFDFWYWNTIEIPLSNYISWAVASFLFQILGMGLKIETGNDKGVFIFCLQIWFFLMLNIF